MDTSIDSILKFLPEIKLSPLPEVIFLSTIKTLIVPAASLSLSQWGTIGSLILLTNVSPALRKATVKLYGYLSLIIGAEIALINAYVLVCSWISPSTTLQPLTVVVLNVLNSLVPVYADSLVLFHLIKEKVSHSGFKANLISTLGAPILLKCLRLASAVMYIRASTEFVITSFTTPDTAILETGRMWNVFIPSSLHLIDNLYSLRIHWSHINKIRSLASSGSPLVPMSLYGLVWSLGSQYILPIVLNAAQLAISSYIPSGNGAMLIDSAKVMINIASASVTTLRKNFAASPAQSALLGKAEDMTRDMLKVPVLDHVSTASAMEELVRKVSTPKLDRLSSSPESS